MDISLELIERFHDKWEHREGSECWHWHAAKMGKGYGYIKIPGTRKQIGAHRLSYMIHYHVSDIPVGMQVCHTCDNPSCVKPSHLFLGTSHDNHLDMVEKDRHLYGTRNKKSKLNDAKVRQIHRLLSEGLSTAHIGRIFGVTQSVIWRISKGMSWKHIYLQIHGGPEVAIPAEHK